jgi:geranylgeranyl pyrophosphate synthase
VIETDSRVRGATVASRQAQRARIRRRSASEDRELRACRWSSAEATTCNAERLLDIARAVAGRSASPKVASIYGPVQEDLRLVEVRSTASSMWKASGAVEDVSHVLSVSGKRLRPAIALLAGHFGTYNPSTCRSPRRSSCSIPRRLCTTTSSMRRRHAAGRLTANELFTNSVSVMLGDYMFAHSAELISRTDNTKVVRLFAHTIMAIAGGELHQDMSAYDYGQDTIKYFGRIEGKTASLFATSAEGGAMVAGCAPDEREALRTYGLNVGMAFQIVDDILDFAGDEEEMGKPIGSDLLAGTLTLPSLILMDRNPKDNPIKRAFRTKKPKPEYVAEAVYMVLNSDILNESYAVARDFRDRALAALQPLPNIPARAALEDIAEYVLDRRS